MLPVIHIGALELPTYFTMVAISYVMATFVLARSARRQGLDPVIYIDAVLFIGFFSVVGARLFHAIFSMPDFYLKQPLALLKFWYGGFVFYGGLIVGVIAGLFYFSKLRKQPIGRAADLMALPLALSMGLGRMSCLMVGCCYGRQANLPWPLTVVFEKVADVTPSAYPLGEPLLATQFFSSMLHLTLYFFLLWYRSHKRFHGQLLALYLLIYSIGRYGIEWMRNDSERGLFFHGLFSTSQLVSMVIFIVAVAVLVLGRRKRLASQPI